MLTAFSARSGLSRPRERKNGILALLHPNTCKQMLIALINVAYNNSRGILGGYRTALFILKVNPSTCATSHVESTETENIFDFCVSVRTDANMCAPCNFYKFFTNHATQTRIKMTKHFVSYWFSGLVLLPYRKEPCICMSRCLQATAVSRDAFPAPRWEAAVNTRCRSLVPFVMNIERVCESKHRNFPCDGK